MTSVRRREALKIVHIETRYVQTDAMNFRAVVQSLTGKNSSTAWVENGSSLPGGEKIGRTADDSTVSVVKPIITTDHSDNEDGSISSSATLKNMALKDFDRLLSELTPMEDLLWLVSR